MKRINKDNNFLVIWLMSVLLLVGACNLGLIRKTWSGFGNVTGQLTIPCTINYYSNYPDDALLDEEVKTEYVKGQSYIIAENIFDVSGYEFVGWNSTSDGTGNVYNSGDSIPLELSLNFYAQWKKVELEVPVVSYGDVNIDGVINDEDYLLIEQFINTSNELTSQGLLNADVNVDGKVDLVDVDIIRQVCLGTDGYVGILPDNPILIYEIYNDEKVEENEEENDKESNTESNTGGSSSSGGSGTGSSSGGASSGGISGGGNSSSGTSNKPSSNKGNKPSSGGNSGSSKNEQDDLVTDKENNVIDKDEVLDENEDNIILDEDNTEEENNHLDTNGTAGNETKNGNSIYPIIIVIGICLMAFRLIVYVIKRFNEKENNNSD